MNDRKDSPLLTIAIPTWNRAAFLALNLKRLSHEGRNLWDQVEILVSDNWSSDHTGKVVSQAIAAGMPVRYIKNSENRGSDANIAQCFNLALGKYVLIMGDDDFFVDGALNILLKRLEPEICGVVCLRPYGFEVDSNREFPGGRGREQVFRDPGAFLATIGPLMTLISSCAISKQMLPSIDACDFCGENLVQVHLVLRAALAAKENIFLDRYLIACKRNNSGGYDFSRVFVTSLCAVLDSCKPHGLSVIAIMAIESRLMLSYYPFYLLRQRMSKTGDLAATLIRFEERFDGRMLFKYWVRPIIQMPRPLGIIWGAVATVIGRTLNGDLRRGITFAWYRLLVGARGE